MEKSTCSDNLKADFSPAGDQPFAIKEICKSFSDGASKQILMGVTGSGKTYTVSNIIKNLKIYKNKRTNI